MGNCLKTQLKESVNNDNLVKLGDFLVSGKSFDSTFQISTSNYIKVVEGIPVDYNTGNPIIDGVYPDTTIRLNNSSIVVSDKYSITNLNESFIEGSTNDYKYLQSLISLTVGRSGDLRVLSEKHLITLVLQTSSNSNVLDGLAGSKNSLWTYQVYNTDKNINFSYPTLKDLGDFIYLHNYSRGECTAEQTGSIEDFVVAQRAARAAAGKSPTEETGVRILNSYVLFKGEPTSVDNELLTWTTNTITFMGETINV